MAFRASGLTSVTLLNPIPATLDVNAFRDIILSGVKLYVPAGSKELYEAAAIWTDFDIEESEGLSDDNVNKGLNISISPNPTSGFVSITSIENIINVTVLSASGSVVLESNSTQLYFSSFVAGVYFVKVKTGMGVSVKRVMKK